MVLNFINCKNVFLLIYFNILYLSLHAHGYTNDPILLTEQDTSRINLLSPKLIIPIGHTKGIMSVSFSPNGKYALSGSYDNTIKLWDIQSGREIKTFENNSTIRSVSFSPTGNYIRSHSYDHTMKLWDIKSGKILRHFTVDSLVKFSRYSADGQIALLGTDSAIKLWDIQNGKELSSLKDQNNDFHSVIISPDGRDALSIDKFPSFSMKLWDVQSGNMIRTFKGHKTAVKEISISPNGRNALSASHYGTIQLWDIQTGKEIWYSFVKSDVIGISISNDSRYALSGSYDGTITLWELKTGKELRSFKGHSRNATSVCFSPDGRYALSGSDHENAIKLWDLQSGLEIRSYGGDHTKEISSVSFANNNEYALSTSGNSVRLWDFRAGKNNKSYWGHTKWVSSVSFSDDSRFALSVSLDETMRLWDIEDGKVIRVFSNSGESNQRPACFSPDNKYILSGLFDTLKLWDIQNAKVIKSFGGNIGYVNNISFSPDGHYFISGAHNILRVLGKFINTVKLWDLQSGKELWSFGNYTENIHCLSFSPDSIHAITGSYETMKLWNTKSFKEVRSFLGHTKMITSVSFSTDGRWILSGSWDKTLRLWDVQTGNMIKTFKGHRDAVNDISISPNGRNALSSSKDNTIKLWDITSGKEMATLTSIDSTDWVVTTPSGLFDASEGAMKQMYFVAGMEIIELGQLKERYWQPDLLSILMGYNDEKSREVPVLDHVRLYPEQNLTVNNEELLINLKNRNGGIGKVSVYIDNIEIIEDARTSVADSSKQDLQIVINLDEYKEYLNYYNKNVIKSEVWNAEGYLKSSPDTIHFYPRLKDEKGIYALQVPKKEINQPAFYAIIVGTSDYSGQDIDLRYAAKDAKDFANAISLGASRLFGKDSTHIYLLTTDDYQNLPDKKNISATFELLKQAKPKDIVAFYFSGHGVNSSGQDGEFYYLTMDTRATDISKLNDSYFSNYTISSRELTKWINAIPARKKVLILDACASGQAAEDITLAMNVTKKIPGSQSRSLDRMRDRTGFFILAGSAADAVSYETSMFGQGVLTYALLRGLKGESLRTDGTEEYIDIKKLFQYAEDKVPELAKNIGGIQRPFSRGIKDLGSFDIGRMEKEDKEKINISDPKPIFIHSDIKPSDIMVADLELDKIIDGKLMDIAAKGKEAYLMYSEGNYPNAYFIRGRYTTKGDKISIDFILVTVTSEGEQIIGNKITLKNDSGNIDDLADKLINNIINKIQ